MNQNREQCSSSSENVSRKVGIPPLNPRNAGPASAADGGAGELRRTTAVNSSPSKLLRNIGAFCQTRVFNYNYDALPLRARLHCRRIAGYGRTGNSAVRSTGRRAQVHANRLARFFARPWLVPRCGLSSAKACETSGSGSDQEICVQTVTSLWNA